METQGGRHKLILTDVEAFASNPSEPFAATDGSLFLLLGLNKRNHREHKPKETAETSKIRKCDMYRLPSRKISRRAAIHASIPPLRDDR